MMKSLLNRWVHTPGYPWYKRVSGDPRQVSPSPDRSYRFPLEWAPRHELFGGPAPGERTSVRLLRLGDLLQGCHRPEEACAVLHRLGAALFPAASGGLFLLNSSGRMLETAVVWGGDLLSAAHFPAHDCWAVRRSQAHRVQAAAPELICRHMPQAVPGDYLEVPLLAFGDLLGLLHLEDLDPAWSGDHTLAYTSAVASLLALSLSSLRMRQQGLLLSPRDPLTGLFNRRYLDESLNRELHSASRRQIPVGLILLSLDDFNQLTDRFGRQVGEALLSAVGRLLQGCCRLEDIACRMALDEFVLVLPGSPLDVTARRAGQILHDLNAIDRELQITPGAVTACLGVAEFPLHEASAEGLLEKADEAMFQARRLGGNRVVIAGPSEPWA